MIHLPLEELSDLLKSLRRDQRALTKQIVDVCIHSEGSIDYNTAWGLCFEHRELIVKAINKKNQPEGGKEYM